jgi:hypothetical protein
MRLCFVSHPSAGLIMGVSFGAMLGSHCDAINQIGFVLSGAVLIDTFLVRCFVIPAVMALLGEANWWPAATTTTPRATSSTTTTMTTTTSTYKRITSGSVTEFDAVTGAPDVDAGARETSTASKFGATRVHVNSDV